MTTIYRDNEANAIFIEDANGAQFLNSLQATVDNDLVSITDTAKNFDLVTSLDHAEIVDENGNEYGATATEACDALNAIFQASGSTGQIPSITSNTTINLVAGEVLNYELLADYGVGYEWENLPSGVVTVDGNVRKLVGGSSLSVGTYNITAKAINYFGEDSETITLNVSTPPFSNTKSVQFNNQDYIGANAGILQNVLGRSGNGSGSSDAWTVTFWFKASSDSRGQVIMYFGLGTGVGQGGYIELRQTNQGSLKRLRLRYGSQNNYIQLHSPNGSITPGTWQHVAVTYDGGTTGSASSDVNLYYSRFKMYIDGVSQTLGGSHGNYGYSAAMQSGNFRFGRLTSGNSLRGANLDEIAIFDSDESSNISDIYNSGNVKDLSLLTTEPKHWWRMGDGDTYPYLFDTGTEANCIFQMYNMTVSDIVSDVP